MRVKKGFALTLSMIVLVFFLTLIISIESQRINIEEQTRSNHARMRALSSLLADIDSPAMDYALEKLAKRSLYDLDMQVINTSQYLGTGTTASELCKSLSKKFDGYLNSLSSRSSDFGLQMKHSDVKCSANLVGPFDVEVTLKTNISFSGEGILVNKTIDRKFNFSIEGIYDPVLYMESKDFYERKGQKGVLRPIIKSSQNETELKAGPSSQDADYGRGWAYGEVITTTDAGKRGEAEWGDKILFIEDKDLPAWKDRLDKFRGVILKGSSDTTGREDKIEVSCGMNRVQVSVMTWQEDDQCIYCGSYGTVKLPERDCTIDWSTFGNYDIEGDTVYIYSPSGNNIIVNVPFVKTSASYSTGEKVLISNPLSGRSTTDNFPPVHSGSKIYNIEDQRAAVLCGNYFEMGGPSIFSRLEGNKTNTDEYGIETFLVGEWATEPRSKLDYEYYKKEDGNKIMGMPGCLYMRMCNDPYKIGGRTVNEEEMTIGKFRISDSRDDDYGMDDIKVSESG
ncbi:MAG: hypothetical protein ACP5KJ_03035 [Candidatus Micrarchaeia archaeon]